MKRPARLGTLLIAAFLASCSTPTPFSFESSVPSSSADSAILSEESLIPSSESEAISEPISEPVSEPISEPISEPASESTPKSEEPPVSEESSDPKTDSSGTSVEESSKGEGGSSTDEEELPRIDVDEIYNHDAVVSDRLDHYAFSDVLTEFKANKGSFYGESLNYENRLEEPNHTVDNLDEFSAVLDYHAFYGDQETFEVYLSSSFPSPSVSKIHEAFFNSKICVGTVGLNRDYDASKQRFRVQMLFNKEAAKYTANYNENRHYWQVTTPYEFPSKVEPRNEDFEDFPYLTKNDKGIIDVNNSDQLLYALELGYLPVPFPGSPAEFLLTKAKEILRGIIKDDMTQNDKIAAIMAYLTSNARYDTVGDDWAAFCVEEDNYPDYVASNFRSFYAEGGIIDGFCVCHGYGKSFNILANLEGIESIKVSGRYDDDTLGINSVNYTSVGATYSNHGYSYVRNEEDGKFYICDATYSTLGAINDSGRYQSINRRYAAMISYDRWSELYTRVSDHFHLREDAGRTNIDFSPYFKLGEGLSFHVDYLTDISTFLPAFVDYLRTYDNPFYKGSNYCAQINLTIGEYEGIHPSSPEASDIVSSINNYVWDVADGIGLGFPDFRVWGDYYYYSDGGVVLLFHF